MEDDVLTVDLDSLKIREIEEIEEIVGESIETAFADGKPRGKALRALGYVVRRRTQPDFTLEQAGELVIRLDAATEADPTPAA